MAKIVKEAAKKIASTTTKKRAATSSSKAKAKPTKSLKATAKKKGGSSIKKGTYSELQKKNICEIVFLKMGLGLSVRSIFRDNEKILPHRKTFEKWVEVDEGRRSQYAYAKEERAAHIFEEIINIADDSSNDYMENKNGDTVLDSEHVQRSRLRIDSRKWMLSKMLPNKYGDKVTLEGNEEKPFKIIHLGGPKK